VSKILYFPGQTNKKKSGIFIIEQTIPEDKNIPIFEK
jgi:hypothetical protein